MPGPMIPPQARPNFHSSGRKTQHRRTPRYETETPANKPRAAQEARHRPAPPCRTKETTISITPRASLAIVAAAVALSIFCATAQAQTASAQTAQAETVEARTIRHVYEVFNTGDADLLDLVLAEDWVHIPPCETEQSSPSKRERWFG